MVLHKLTLSEVNNLSVDNFVLTFHNIVECYPEVSKQLETLRPFVTIDDVIEKAQKVITHLHEKEKHKILKLHPDLAGRLADEGKLTPESLKEQAAAGLKHIASEDKEILNDLNIRYRKKFGFPFVICARENKFNSILQGIKVRLHNSKIHELHTGIEEVKKICRLRILELVTA